MSDRRGWILAVALAAAAALLPGGTAHAGRTCTSEADVLACFEAYETGLRSFHGAQLDAIANRIAESQAWKEPFDHVALVGHAAFFKKTDPVGKNSRERAASVARALSDRLTARGVRGVKIEQAAHGIATPVATNGTRDGRALNRRVEVFLSNQKRVKRRVAALREVCGTRRARAREQRLNPEDAVCLVPSEARAFCNEGLRLGAGESLAGGACQPLEVRCIVCSKPRG